MFFLIHKTKLAWHWLRPHLTFDLVCDPVFDFLCRLTNMWFANGCTGSLTGMRRDLWLFILIELRAQPRLPFLQWHWANITSLGNEWQQQPCGHWAKCEHDDMRGNKTWGLMWMLQCILAKENPSQCLEKPFHCIFYTWSKYKKRTFLLH